MAISEINEASEISGEDHTVTGARPVKSVKSVTIAPVTEARDDTGWWSQ